MSQIKENFIKVVEKSLQSSYSGRNSMGGDERNYDIYYMIGRALKENNIALEDLSEDAIEKMCIVAQYASDAFY